MKIFQFLPVLLLAGTPACAQDAPATSNSNGPKIETRVQFQTLPKPTKTEDNIVFPADSGVADVTKAPYNADPTGKTDSTLAIQQALTEKKTIVYLPNGTYLISDQLRWGERQTRQILQGQSEGGTIIKLADNAPGYGAPTQPKSMIWTGKAPAQRFRNGIRNLTVHTGKGNAGAIGIQYIANNQGAMHHVSIISGDGSGPIGLDLGYTNEQGPCLIKDVTVKGFDLGVFTKHAVDGVVLENIRVENQNVAGFLNDGQCVSLRGFSSLNSVPAFQNKRGASLLSLDVADLQGTGAASEVSAIENEAGLLARNITTAGYKTAIDNKAGKVAQVAGPKVGEFVSHPILSLFPSPPRTLNLPVKATPEPANDQLKDWVNVRDFKPKPTVLVRPDGKKVNYDDWTDAIQQAIDSGKSTIYFPAGPKFIIGGTVKVRGNVKRLIGMDADAWNKPAGVPNGIISIEDGAAPVVVFERFDITYSGLKLQHNSKRTLVVSSIQGNEHVKLEKMPGSGDVFLEDVCVGQYLAADGNTWARQLNLEGWHLRPKLINDGGTVWVLGFKTEEDALLLDAKNGAKSEIFGGFIFANKKRDPEKVMFSSDNSALSVSVGEWVGRQQPFNPVRETRGKETRVLKAGMTPKRGEGSLIPLFVGYSGNATTAPAAPEKLAATPKGTGQIDLSWTAKAGADGLLLETSTDGKEFKAVDTLLPETTNYSITSGLKAGTAYFVRLTAFNGKGQAATAPVKVSTIAPAAIGTGTGLRGEYYVGRGFETLKTTRTDAGVNLDWKTAALPDGLDAKNLTVRWTGQIEPRYSETYAFSTERSGTRVWIDGKPVITGWAGRNYGGSIALEAGKKYDIKMEMWSDRPGAAATLNWSSFNQTKEIVPASQLYPASSPQTEVKIGASAPGIAETDAKGAQITVSRSGDTKTALEVALKISGSAAPNADYKALPDTISIPAGSERATFVVAPVNEKQAEGDETVEIAVAPSAFYNLSGGAANVTIKDDDLPPLGNGTGLKGEYFDDRAMTQLKGTRTDSRVDFAWNKADPFPGITPKKTGRTTDGYAVRWSGEMLPLFSEKYTFELNFGNYAGAKLKIGDTVVVDADDLKKPRVGTIELKAGQKYPVTLEMVQRNTYDGRMQFKWASPSQFEQVVPKSQLFPAP